MHACRYTIIIDKEMRDWWKRIVETIFYAVRFVLIIHVHRLLLTILYNTPFTQHAAKTLTPTLYMSRFALLGGGVRVTLNSKAFYFRQICSTKS